MTIAISIANTTTSTVVNAATLIIMLAALL